MNRLLPLALLLWACNGPSGAPPAPPPPVDSVRAQAAPPDTLRNGHQRVRDSGGRLLMEGDLVDGRRNGLWTAYHPNGTVQSRTEYRLGVPHGLTTTFRPNGALLYKGRNADGHPVGTWAFHDDIGTLVRTVEYDSAGVEIKR